MTTLIDLTLPPPLPEPEPLAGGTFFAPLPLLHAASVSARALTPASSAVVRLFIPFPPAVSRLDRDAVMSPPKRNTILLLRVCGKNQSYMSKIREHVLIPSTSEP